MRFIINTLTHWEEPPRARHQVTFALAKKFKVAYVAANNKGFPRIDITDQNENIVLIQPYFPLDVRIRYRIPLFNEIYQLWLFAWLKKKYNDIEIINFDFSAYLIHRYFRRVYYYCNDNFAAISRKINVWPIYIYHSFCERRLTERAAFCVGTSPIIAANLRKINIRSYEIPLGGPNIEEYHLKPAEKKINTKRIHIGLVGFISIANLSYQLINTILSKIDCTVTLIGPVDREFYDRIMDKERVDLKGVLKDKELLSEVNKFDVTVAPYLDNKIAEGGMPNKLFVYLSMGKPVVVTELLCLTQMNLPEKFIYLVKNNDDFPDIIRKAHDENNSALIQLRVEYAEMNTWDKRIEKFCELL
ncbi:MAG: glycosyltransferase [Bacteroidales bacterium]|nr:glycosyltransferase [Bacteroidales bacterium]